MSEYKVELVEAKIKKIEVMIELEEDTALQINSEYSASVFEPNDVNDPTALVKVEATFKDATEKMLDVTCSADFIFMIDPIPEDRVEILSKTTRTTIQEELTAKLVAVLNGMGHKFAFS